MSGSKCPEPTSCFTNRSSADRNTSNGAPFSICWASEPLDASVNRILLCDAFSKPCSSAAVRGERSEAPATIRSPARATALNPARDKATNQHAERRDAGFIGVHETGAPDLRLAWFIWG